MSAHMLLALLSCLITSAKSEHLFANCHYRITQNQALSPSGEITSYLNISSAHVEDGGEYTCVARNQAGEATHSSRLNVYGMMLPVLV